MKIREIQKYHKFAFENLGKLHAKDWVGAYKGQSEGICGNQYFSVYEFRSKKWCDTHNGWPFLCSKKMTIDWTFVKIMRPLKVRLGTQTLWTSFYGVYCAFLSLRLSTRRILWHFARPSDRLETFFAQNSSNSKISHGKQ